MGKVRPPEKREGSISGTRSLTTGPLARKRPCSARVWRFKHTMGVPATMLPRSRTDFVAPTPGRPESSEATMTPLAMVSGPDTLFVARRRTRRLPERSASAAMCAGGGASRGATPLRSVAIKGSTGPGPPVERVPKSRTALSSSRGMPRPGLDHGSMEGAFEVKFAVGSIWRGFGAAAGVEL